MAASPAPESETRKPEPEAPDAAQRAEFDAAFAEGAFGKALGAYQLGLIRRAIALLSKADYGVEWGRKPLTPVEFAGGLAHALDLMVEKQGEEASYKLLVARDVVVAIAHLQQALDKEAGDPERFPDTLAELMLLSVRLGNVEVTLGQTEGGFIDEYADLKWREHLDLERRRKGAKGANDARAQKRTDVLLAAQQIVKANRALPNDDLAFTLKSKLQVPQSIRTITGWLRGWRADGRLPPLGR